jgi:hypothetical protein
MPSIQGFFNTQCDLHQLILLAVAKIEDKTQDTKMNLLQYSTGCTKNTRFGLAVIAAKGKCT